jgi:hypothetical protein
MDYRDWNNCCNDGLGEYMGIIDPKCIEWGEWYDDPLDPCTQHRKCGAWGEDPGFFATEDNLGPGGTEQTPTDTVTLMYHPTKRGFVMGGILALIWIAYRK